MSPHGSEAVFQLLSNVTDTQRKTINMLSLFVLSLVAAASAGVVHDGKCPELKAVENFNLTGVSSNFWNRVIFSSFLSLLLFQHFSSVLDKKLSNIPIHNYMLTVVRGD